MCRRCDVLKKGHKCPRTFDRRALNAELMFGPGQGLGPEASSLFASAMTAASGMGSSMIPNMASQAFTNLPPEMSAVAEQITTAAATIAAAVTATATAAAAAAAATTGARGGHPLVESIERVALGYLGSTGPARDAAAICLARLLTRPGLQHQLSRFIKWAGGELASGRKAAEAAGGAGVASFLTVGVYTALAAIFKLGHRAELLPQLPLLGPLRLLSNFFQ